MILQFRTERDKYGHCLYLAIDTGAEAYATEAIGYICKEYPVLKRKDYKAIINQLDKNNFARVDYM